MKFLVFGAGGMAGHMIALYLKERGHGVTGFVREKGLERFPCMIGDAMEKGEVRDALESGNWDVAVNVIGILNKAVDADLATGIYLDSVFPHLLADYLKNRETKLYHISSDCVFLGDKGSYKEDSYKDADSYYGKTKALGEVVDDKNLTFRTSIVGPELKKDGVGLLHWFMNQRSFVNGFTDVIWTGVTTLVLAQAIEQAAIQGLPLMRTVPSAVINRW